MSFLLKSRNKLGTLFICLILIFGKGIVGKINYERVQDKGIETVGNITQKIEKNEWFSEEKVYYFLVEFSDVNGLSHTKNLKVNSLIYQTVTVNQLIRIKYLKASPSNAIVPKYERPMSAVAIWVFTALIIISGGGFLILINKTYTKGYLFNFSKDGLWFAITIPLSIVLVAIIPI